MSTCPAVVGSTMTSVFVMVAECDAATSADFAHRSYVDAVADVPRAGQRCWQRSISAAPVSASAPCEVIHVPDPGSGLFTVTPGSVPPALVVMVPLPTL